MAWMKPWPGATSSVAPGHVTRSHDLLLSSDTGTDDSTEKPQKRSSQDFQKILEVFPPDQILKMFQMMSDLTKNFEALEKKVEKVLN